MPIIDCPHPDLEIGVPRQPVAYNLVFPSAGLSARTGVLFYIHGFGVRFNDAYAEKLLVHLADTYDCLAVCVDYQGAASYAWGTRRWPAPDFFVQLARHYGVSVEAPAGTDIWAIVTAVCRGLHARGVTELHPDCHTLTGVDGYANYGLLPALDHLQVLGRLLRDFPVDRRRLFVLGTSYGGYIGLLLGKLAPSTFRLIVDNSGFTGPDDNPDCVYGIGRSAEMLRITNRCLIGFSADPASPHFLSPGRRRIRDMAVADHYALPSETVIYSYHSATDTVAPAAFKTRLAALLAPLRRYDLRLVSAADVDGRLFKTTAHGMEASLRGLFELSYRRWTAGAADPPAVTDFDLGTANRLPCGEADYVLTFGRDDVALTIDAA